MANKQRKQPKYSNPDPMSNVRDMGRYGIRVIRDIAKGKFNFYNEGHIFISLQNEGDKDYVIEKGEAYAQGIFMKYLLSDDDTAEGTRIGGLGSSNKRKDDEYE